MHAWESIQNSLEYIEKNLHENINMERLAAEAALSVFYFQRLFSRLVKHPVREYIKLRRLARACDALEKSGDRILDIALECGFKSHETFTKVFKEAYGMTPEAYRKNPVTLVHMNKPELLLNYILIDEGVPLISEGIVLEFNRRRVKEPVHFVGVTGLIPIEGQTAPGESTGVDHLGEVWDKFHREKHLIRTKPGGRSLDVSFKGDAPEGHYTFFAGAEIEGSGEDSRFEKWTLPPREYIVCGFEAENFDRLVTDAVYKAWGYCRLWLENHGLTMDREAPSPEMYYDDTPEGTYMEIWLAANEKK